jgi:hypothetical protein
MTESKEPHGVPGVLELPAFAAVPGVTQPPDVRLLQIARDERLANAGTSAVSFARCNVAVARVRVGGRTEYLSAGNLPHKAGGIHSEEYLLAQVHDLRKRWQEVRVEQLYSERIPCAKICMPIIKERWPAAAVFYSVSIPLDPRDTSRAAALMRVYGLR